MKLHIAKAEMELNRHLRNRSSIPERASISGGCEAQMGTDNDDEKDVTCAHPRPLSTWSLISAHVTHASANDGK